MKILLLFITLLTVTFSKITPLSECGVGKATYYSTYAKENVACKLGNDYPSNIYRVAPNEKFFLQSNQCGICYELTGEIGSVVVMVSDLCPATAENKGNCDGDHIHFDMGENAFPFICNKPAGGCNLTYRMVACNVEGNVKLKTTTGVSQWWLGFYARNYVVGLKSVKISFGKTTREMTRSQSNQWSYQTQSGEAITTPVTVTFTSIAGDEATIVMNDIVAEKEYVGQNQFKIPNSTFFNTETLKQSPMPQSYNECCSIPDNSVIYHDKMESFWNVGYGTYTNDKTVKKEGEASMKFTWAQWNGMNVGVVSHLIPKKLYQGLQFYVKGSQSGSISLWHLSHKDKKKTIPVTTEWVLQKVSFNELLFSDDYFKGFEIQSTTNKTVDFYFDEIKLTSIDSVCYQYCSDHVSQCKVISNSSSSNSSNSNGPSSNPSNSNSTGSNGTSSNPSNGKSSSKCVYVLMMILIFFMII